MSDIHLELERLKKDMAGIVEISAELKDKVEDLELENAALRGQVKNIKTKGISATLRAEIRNLKSCVQKVSQAQLLDRQYVTNNMTAMLGMTKEFQQTVAANDHH